MFSFKPRPLYSRGKRDDSLEAGDREGLRDRLDVLGIRKISSFAENIATVPRSAGRVLVAALSELSQLLLRMQMT